MSIVKKDPIIAMTPGADLSAAEGKFVKLSAGNPILIDSATSTVPFGVVIDGETAAGQASIGVCGGALPTVHVKLSGGVSKGEFMQLAGDGTVVVDAGSGGRIVVALALETGVSGDLIEAVILTPVKYT